MTLTARGDASNIAATIQEGKMEKLTVYGLPFNPMSALEQLKGASFCVSYGTRKKLGRQLDQAIRLVGKDGILLVDNGAWSAHQAGINTMTDESYLVGFAHWANRITERCPQAIVVAPDVIGGTEEENCALYHESMMLLDAGDRLMPVWHLHESIKYLLHLCDGGANYIAFGSSGDYLTIGTDKWHGRIAEAFAAIDAWEKATGNVRPRIHMMRGQAQAHRYAFDSSDSVNLAMNHNRQRRVSGETLIEFADRIDGKIQSSAGPEAPHQAINRLEDLQACTNAFAIEKLTELGFEVEGDPNYEPTEEELAELHAWTRRAWALLRPATAGANDNAGGDIPAAA
jgi:hypothetical protein